jgi:hypothetical protein
MPSGAMQSKLAKQSSPPARASRDAAPGLELLGPDAKTRLPVFSFRIPDGAGDPVHHQKITRMLSDLFGVQARGGCVCAEPFGHRLLHISHDASCAMRNEILHGNESHKPGWVRLNLHFAVDDATVETIIAPFGI